MRAFYTSVDKFHWNLQLPPCEKLQKLFNSYDVILGSSSSSRRRVLLSHLGVTPLYWVAPSIDETKFASINSYETASAIANAKADACVKLLAEQVFCNITQCVTNEADADTVHRTTHDAARINSPCFLVCSDQVVHYGSETRQKPCNRDEAKRYINDYATKDIPIETISALVVMNTYTGSKVQGIETSRVWFSPIPKSEIDEIVAQGLVLHSAGGFMIDDEIMGKFVRKIEGSEDAILGMPLTLFFSLLEKLVDFDGGWNHPNVEICKTANIGEAAH